MLVILLPFGGNNGYFLQTDGTGNLSWCKQVMVEGAMVFCVEAIHKFNITHRALQ